MAETDRARFVLWKPNPAGLFSPTNPNVKCTGYPFTLSEEGPYIVEHPKH